MAAIARNSNVSLLACLVDVNDTQDSSDGEYRFLVDGDHIKYVTVEPGVVPSDDRTFGPDLIPQLPAFPPGDWNEGRVCRDEQTGKAAFSSTSRAHLPGIGNAWHPVVIDFLELTLVERVRQTLYQATHPSFPGRMVLAKFAQFPWQIPYFAAETTSYEWIHGKGIGPEFLGHIHEDGRVIGFLLEKIPDVRTAEVEDLAACQRSLGRLHALGIKHGDINKHNFLIRGSEAVLIDFETTQRCQDEGELEEEYRRLRESLEDTSGRGGEGMASDSSSDF